jgi:hypothetical protein
MTRVRRRAPPFLPSIYTDPIETFAAGAGTGGEEISVHRSVVILRWIDLKRRTA